MTGYVPSDATKVLQDGADKTVSDFAPSVAAHATELIADRIVYHLADFMADAISLKQNVSDVLKIMAEVIHRTTLQLPSRLRPYVSSL
jgi:hypothetical protein